MVVNESNFHLLMGAALFASTFVDRAIRAAFPGWNPPEVSLLTLVIGLLWVAVFVGYRMRGQHDDVRVLRERVDRAEQRMAAMEDHLRRERTGGGWPKA